VSSQPHWPVDKVSSPPNWSVDRVSSQYHRPVDTQPWPVSRDHPPFWRPKKTQSRVMPFSNKVLFTMFSGSLRRVTTFCWIISCRACSSSSYRAWIRQHRSVQGTANCPNNIIYILILLFIILINAN